MTKDDDSGTNDRHAVEVIVVSLEASLESLDALSLNLAAAYVSQAIEHLKAKALG